MSIESQMLPYTAGHRHEFERMVLALYAEDPQGETMTAEKVARTIDELAQHPEKGTIYILQVQEQVVGYAIVVWFWSNEYGGDIAVIDELYVKPAWRNCGVGTRFISQLAERAGLQGLELQVTPNNERAREYYLRLGFVPANQHLFRRCR